MFYISESQPLPVSRCHIIYFSIFCFTICASFQPYIQSRICSGRENTLYTKVCKYCVIWIPPVCMDTWYPCIIENIKMATEAVWLLDLWLLLEITLYCLMKNTNIYIFLWFIISFNLIPIQCQTVKVNTFDQLIII